MVARKNVGTKIPSSDDSIGRSFDSRPPFRVEQNLLSQPVRDVLLASLAATERAQPLSKLRLPPGDLDRPTKSGNVSFLHDWTKYTNRIVSATTPFVGHGNKDVCKVLPMTTGRSNALRKLVRPPPKARPPKRQAIPGPDGLTLGQRLTIAIAHETGRRGREYRQVDLLADVNRLAGRRKDDPLLTQQMLSAIMRGTVTRSSSTAFLAVACHVNPLWLGEGVGKMSDL